MRSFICSDSFESWVALHNDQGKETADSITDGAAASKEYEKKTYELWQELVARSKEDMIRIDAMIETNRRIVPIEKWAEFFSNITTPLEDQIAEYKRQSGKISDKQPKRAGDPNSNGSRESTGREHKRNRHNDDDNDDDDNDDDDVVVYNNGNNSEFTFEEEEEEDMFI